MKAKIILLLLLYCPLVNSQTDLKSGVITYEEDFGTLEHNIFELQFCGRESFYEQFFPSRTGQSIETIGGFVEPQIKTIYYTDIKNNKLFFQEGIAFKTIITEENQTKIDWKIEEENKKIGEFLCQKATTIYKGNPYTAWFTTEIPLPFGPWKFHGLPGLIIECHDDSYFYKMKAVKINLGNDCMATTEKIQKFKMQKRVSMQKYLELRNSENEDIFNFYQSISPRDSYLKVESDYTGFMREPLK